MKIGKGVEVKVGDIILAQLLLGEHLWGVWKLAGDEPIDLHPTSFRPLILSKKLVRYSFAPDPEDHSYYLISNSGSDQYFLHRSSHGLDRDNWRVYIKRAGSSYFSEITLDLKYFHELQHLRLDLDIDISRLKRFLYGKCDRKYRNSIREIVHVSYR